METTKLLNELDAIAAKVAKLRAEVVATAPVENAQAQLRVAANLCTYCGEPLKKEKPNRGAHSACYRKAMRRVETDMITDAQLVTDGLLLPQKRQGRKVALTDPVLQKLQVESERKAEEVMQSVKSRGPKTRQTK